MSTKNQESLLIQEEDFFYYTRSRQGSSVSHVVSYIIWECLPCRNIQSICKAIFCRTNSAAPSLSFLVFQTVLYVKVVSVTNKMDTCTSASPLFHLQQFFKIPFRQISKVFCLHCSKSLNKWHGVHQIYDGWRVRLWLW